MTLPRFPGKAGSAGNGNEENGNEGNGNEETETENTGTKKREWKMGTENGNEKRETVFSIE